MKDDRFRNEEYFFQRKYIVHRCLDFGSGKGSFTKFLRTRGHKVIPVDIENHCEDKSVAPTRYDGHVIPFRDDYFETSFCLFVLHHLANQSQILKKLGRVTSQYIIVAEDILELKIDTIICDLHLHAKEGLWNPPGLKDIFHSDEKWNEIFKQSNLSLESKYRMLRFKIISHPILRMIYVLKNTDQDKARV